MCKQEVEDEEHFLLKCSKLNTIRNDNFKQIIDKYKNFKTLNNEQKLTWLLVSEDNFIISSVAKLINKLFKEREVILSREGAVSLHA